MNSHSFDHHLYYGLILAECDLGNDCLPLDYPYLLLINIYVLTFFSFSGRINFMFDNVQVVCNSVICSVVTCLYVALSVVSLHSYSLSVHCARAMSGVPVSLLCSLECTALTSLYTLLWR